MPKTTFIIFVLFGCTFLAACGTKGPLYIPEQRYPQGAEQAPAKAPSSNSTNQAN